MNTTGDETEEVPVVHPSATPRRGPRLGGGVGREQILQVATHQFAEYGYQATTIRKIAQAAGVDAKLVHYYFGTKGDLFAATIGQAFRSRGLPKILLGQGCGPAVSAGTQYLVAALTALEDPNLGPAFIGLARNLGTHEESRRIFLRFINEEILGHLVSQLQQDHAQIRMALVGTQLLGLVFARYVLKVPPIATLSIEEISRTVGPNIDRYLVGDLDWDELNADDA